MKTFIALLAFVISTAAATAFAQDVIVLKTGDEIKSKVIEITPTEIKYKKFDNLQGPTIIISKSDVFMIKYANGTKDVMTSSNSPANTQSENVASTNMTPASPGDIGLYVMPLGFLQFGPILGVEYTANPNLSVGAHVRIPSLGLLTYAVFTSDGETADVISGLGIGADVKYYSQSVRNGFYFGGLLEYAYGSATYSQGYTGEWINSNTFLVIACDGGYKFDLSKNFFLNVGATLGAVTSLSVKPSVFPNETNPSEDKSGPTTTIFGMLDLTFGVNL
ncbi:MAG: hypothetical protein WAO19_14165 [Candidatus Kryptoniota bacterium]